MRCRNPNNPRWHQYGGRGIKVCDRWESFEAFYEDVGPRPTPEHSLDRIDNDGDYAPENCRWATRDEQNTNKRCNVRVPYNGAHLTIAELSKEVGVPYALLHKRIWRGWSVERAVSEPNMRG